MSSLEEKRENRLKFLNALYEETDGSPSNYVSMWDVGQKLGFEADRTSIAVEYLTGEGLMKHVALGGEVAITHYGRKEIENALSAPERPTTYFPPVINILQVQNMTGSQIQQGTQQSSQKVLISSADAVSITEFLKLLKKGFPDLELDPETKSEATAEIATIETQLTSSRPKATVIFECLKSIRTILEGATGSVVAELMPQVVRLISNFQP